MKTNFRISFVLIAILLLAFGCKKEDPVLNAMTLINHVYT